MSAGGSCPDENALVRFSGGQLSGLELGQLEQHLDSCEACRGLIAQLASGATARAGAAAVGMIDRHATLAPDAKIGRYRVERLLGAGGMGVVYAARDTELNRTVAIKLLASGNTALEPRARLLREAQTMAKLSHPNLVPIFELGTDAGHDFLAMELIPGPTLDQWLREGVRGWREIVRIFLDAGRGLEAAHAAGITHRDFKPGNVLIGPDGRARVTDFGLARPDANHPSGEEVSGPLLVTQVGTVMGTPAYMAPEQLEGHTADARADQFSFCVALYEALVGQRPFAGRNVAELRETLRSGKPAALGPLPRSLRRAIGRGLSLDPAGRFESIGALLEAISRPVKPRILTPAVGVGIGVAVLLVGTLVWQQRTADGARLAQTQKRLEEAQAAQQLDRAGREAADEARRAEEAAANPEQEGPGIVLFPSEQTLLPGKGIRRVAVDDLKIAGATRTDDGQILVIGVSVGRTSLVTWDEKNRRTRHPVSVAARPMSLSLEQGSSMVVVVPRLRRIAIGDSDIANVKTVGDDRLKVTGVTPGITTLIAWSDQNPPNDQKRQSWEVRVTEARPTGKK